MKPPSGPELERKLSPYFPIGKATRKQSGEFKGCHTIEFFHKGWDKPVLPAAEYAAQLTRHLSDFEVVHFHHEMNTWAASPFLMCTTLVIQFVQRVQDNHTRARMPVYVRRDVLMLPPGRIARYAVGQVITIPGMQRKSAVLEVDRNKTEPFYRVRLDGHIDHAWYSEEQVIKWNKRIEVLEFVADVKTKAA